MIQLTKPVDATDHVLGPEDAIVTMVEYGSYDCPHCRQALAVTLSLMQELNAGGRAGLRLVYRHFPSQTPHSLSQMAAEAAEAAGSQGKFWEMHEHLLRNQSALDETNLLAHAMIVGLDRQRFATELEGRAYQEKVREMFQSGRESGVVSTPTFFINGVRHDGDWDLDTLRRVVGGCA